VVNGPDAASAALEEANYIASRWSGEIHLPVGRIASFALSFRPAFMRPEL
jgi:hypothetical protein